MARGLPRQNWQIIIFITALFYGYSASEQEYPEFNSLKVLNISNYTNEIENVIYKKVEFLVRGQNLFWGLQIKTTQTQAVKNTTCKEDLSSFKNIRQTSGRYNVATFVMYLPLNAREELYFCLTHEAVNDELITPGLSFEGTSFTWYHQGNISIPLVEASNTIGNNFLDLTQENKQYLRSPRSGSPSELRVTGLRVDMAPKEPSIDENGVPFLLAGGSYVLRLFGKGFSENMLITFTQQRGQFGGACQKPGTDIYKIVKDSLSNNTAQVAVKLPVDDIDGAFYICVKEGGSENDKDGTERVSDVTPFIHQGTSSWTSIRSFEKMIPIWVAILIICVCLCFSALFSGLNLGLMSLDRTELKILCNTGTLKERAYAKKIQPVRNHGNFLLCSILLGNVLVNSTFTILLDDLTSGVIAIVCSTLAIVMFGEITPQAICSRHGLAVGAKTIYVTKLVMMITFPLSYPISKLLDVMLGEEIGSVYTRERLKELVKVTTGENDLDREEINIISGALELRKKTVADVMTKMEDTFMLDYDAILDFETVSEIMKSGYSRIPVFQNDRKNIITTMYIKDLAFVDPDDNTPLKTLCQFYQNPCNFVFEDVTLDIMFKDFKQGNKGHMAFINRVNNEGEGDPFYETIGLITLEDVIEELIQAEIMDETDVFTDNRTKRRRNADTTKQDFTVFAERRGENNRIRISPQLVLATFQYLATTVDLFKPEQISETILRRLLKQDIIYHIKKNKDWKNDPLTIIYEQGKAVDYFVLILEGRVEVQVGRENLVFESGPFTYFGTQALQQNVGVAAIESPSALGSLQSLNMDSMLRYTFQPDYGVRACGEVLYMKVKRNLYMAAKRASLMERSQRDNTNSGDQFDDEVEKLLYSFEEDGSCRNSPEPNRTISDYMTDVTYHNGGNTAAGGDSTATDTTRARTPSIKSHTSPVSATRRGFGSRELNGTVKYPPPIDIEVIGKEEEVSLLPKKS